ncbi:MAG: hypothetical protein ILA19_02990 [Bacilli bacterium]|nr:hypothetical protein [Bacilli bacterium]
MKAVKVITNSFLGNLFLPIGDIKVNTGDYVVIDSEKGLFLGQIIGNEKECDHSIIDEGKILRIATKDDIKDNEKNVKENDKVLSDATSISRKLGLDMTFVDSIYSLDKKRLYLSFVADDRIDFRELAKRLAQKYHARIEFRQIGVRDKAKIVGGIGPCGLMLCCNKFLNDFESVSINMAKNQLLALNPTKINGVCGRLMCCLNYENDVYSEIKKNMPKIGNLIDTPDGKGKVVELNILNKTCKVEYPNKTTAIIKIEE